VAVAGVTGATKVTDCPTCAGLVRECSVVEVGAGLVLIDNASDRLPRKVEAPSISVYTSAAPGARAF
jgi:hypothetical protein